MRKFVSWLFLALAVFTPVAVVAGLVSLYLRMSAINNGATGSRTGHNYVVNAQRFLGSKLIVYVTYNYYMAYLISASIFFLWGVSIVCTLTAAQILRLGKQVK